MIQSDVSRRVPEDRGQGRPPSPRVRPSAPPTRRARRSGPPEADQVLTAWTTVALSLLVLPILTVARETPWGVLAGLAVLCIIPGTAVLAWYPTDRLLTRVLAVVAASLTWSVLICTLLAGAQRMTRPNLVISLLVIPLLLSAWFLVRQQLLAPGGERPRPAAPNATSLRALGLGSVIGPLMLVVSVGLWLYSIQQARNAPLGAYGLIPMLGPSFIVALALAVGTIMWALSARLATVSGLALGLVVLFLNGTPAMVADLPLAGWGYKHFGAVDYIVSGAPLSNRLDVFQQWPGFFAEAAALVELTGVSPMAYANWAQFFFEALNALTVFAITRRLAASSKEVAHLTVLLFVTSAWAGQRYYAPQSLAFLMWLLFIYFALPMTDPSRTRLRKLWQRRRSGLRAIYAAPVWFSSVLTDRKSRSDLVVPGLTLMFTAITITHQLTPYMVLAGLVGLWVIGVLPRPSLMVSCGVILVLSSVWHRGAISGQPWLSLFQFANATGVSLGTTSPQQELAATLARVVGLGLWLLAAIAVTTYRRRFWSVALPTVLAFAPFALVVVQSYGGEGIYRVYLFSSVWCALIISMRMIDLRRFLAGRWALLTAWAVLAGLASAQATVMGMYPTLVMSTSEVTASRRFSSEAPTDSVLVMAAPSFPGRLDRNYVRHNPMNTVNDPALTDISEMKGTGLADTSPKALATQVSELAKGRGYLVISQAMLAFNEYYGAYSSGTLEELVPRLVKTPYWKVWYQNRDTIVLEATPA